MRMLVCLVLPQRSLKLSSFLFLIFLNFILFYLFFLYNRFLLVIYFIHISKCMSIPICPHFFSFFCLASVISTTLSSSSLIHSSVSSNILFIPSSVYFISFILFFISVWFFIFLNSLFKTSNFSFCSSNLLLSIWRSSQSLPWTFY